MQNQGQIDLFGQLFEKGSADRGLAGTHFAREEDEATTLPGAVDEMRQGLPMLLTQEEILWIGGDGKAGFLEAEIIGVHGLGIDEVGSNPGAGPGTRDGQAGGQSQETRHRPGPRQAPAGGPGRDEYRPVLPDPGQSSAHATGNCGFSFLLTSVRSHNVSCDLEGLNGP